MQRLSSTPRNKENTPNGDESKAKEAERIDPVEITPELLFLLSRYETGISNRYVSSKKESDSNLAKDLKIAAPCFFADTVELPRNLKVISIKNSCLIDIGCFEGLSLQKLEFENVLSFEISHLDRFSLQSLVLKDLSVNTERLQKMIEILSPKTLDLIDVRLRDPNNDVGRNKVYSAIEQSGICSLRVEDGFMPIDHFFSIVRYRNIKRFSYKHEDSLVKCRALGRGYSYFVVRKLDLTPFFDISWLDVDILSVDANPLVLSSIRPETTRTKFLWIENAKITMSLVTRLPKLTSIYVKGCVFEARSFYGLISTQRKALRYISFNIVDVPFDGMQYILGNIKECKVAFNSITLNS